MTRKTPKSHGGWMGGCLEKVWATIGWLPKRVGINETIPINPQSYVEFQWGHSIVSNMSSPELKNDRALDIPCHYGLMKSEVHLRLQFNRPTRCLMGERPLFFGSGMHTQQLFLTILAQNQTLKHLHQILEALPKKEFPIQLCVFFWGAKILQFSASACACFRWKSDPLGHLITGRQLDEGNVHLVRCTVLPTPESKELSCEYAKFMICFSMIGDLVEGSGWSI